MKILFVVITCNRLHYLVNCVKSITNFVHSDDVGLMIVDNNTIERGSDDYFNNLPSNIMVHRFKDRVPNELYRAMNYGIEYCMQHKIPFINFIQDDYQFVYELDSMIPAVLKCFKKYSKIGQINYNMVWRRKDAGSKSVVQANRTRFAILNDKNLVDNGFTRVKIYKKAGLYPSGVISYDQNSEKTFGFGKNRYKNITNGELWFGKITKKLGYKRAISLMPNQVMLFDCAYVRHLLRFGKYFPPSHDFYIKPFDTDKIDQVKRRHDKKKWCFIEDLAEPWGWIPTTTDKHNREHIKNKIGEEGGLD